MGIGVATRSLLRGLRVCVFVLFTLTPTLSLEGEGETVVVIFLKGEGAGTRPAPTWVPTPYHDTGPGRRLVVSVGGEGFSDVDDVAAEVGIDA